MADGAKKPMPKGGRKGGTKFPRLGLAKSLEYSTRLVSRTHTGALAENLILPGVFGHSGSVGRIRMSALRQFGLIKGGNNAIEASELAKSIEAAPIKEKVALVRTALLLPKVFKGLYDTFQGGTVARAKLRQQAIKLNVHPDAAEDCVTCFVDSLVAAESGDEGPEGVRINSFVGGHSSEIPASTGDGPAAKEEQPQNDVDSTTTPEQVGPSDEKPTVENAASAPRAVFHVNVTLDSSLDTDKLERQLQLLRRFGAL